MTTNESFFFRDEKPFVHFRARALPRAAGGAADGGRAADLVRSELLGSGGLFARDDRRRMPRAARRPARGDRRHRSVGRAGRPRARRPLQPVRDPARPADADAGEALPQGGDAAGAITDALRERVQFREWNLLADLRPLGRFDIVFCRNVLIYFDQPTKRRVLEAIAQQMPPDGFLYLGGAETVLGITDRFVPLNGERGVYGLAAPGRPDRRSVARGDGEVIAARSATGLSSCRRAPRSATGTPPGRDGRRHTSRSGPPSGRNGRAPGAASRRASGAVASRTRR